MPGPNDWGYFNGNPYFQPTQPTPQQMPQPQQIPFAQPQQVPFAQPQPAPQRIDMLRDRNTMNAALNQFRQNPVGMLRNLGFNIPQNLSDPNQIGPYLLQTGQISQGTINQIISINPNFAKFFSK